MTDRLVLDAAVCERAVEYLRRRDRILRPVIERVGPCPMRPQGKPFEMLLRSIISQQISTAAARNIRQRVQLLSRTGRLSLRGLADVSDEAFRAAGISPQKLTYIRALMLHARAGGLKLTALQQQSDEEVIETLTVIKGIGVWTAQMYLMFGLGRCDVLPAGDLGIRRAVEQLYGFDPAGGTSREEHFAAATAVWKPYATVASWYCWRSLE